jgi:hypothetical protein
MLGIPVENHNGQIFMLWGLGWKELQGDVGQLGRFGYAKGNLRQLFKVSCYRMLDNVSIVS